jgi:sigma-B regulation protein RsbU (phosphoserine phosphatase)
VTTNRADWPANAPGIAFIDLADAGQPVRELRLTLGERTELVAIVDNESVEGLIPALAAGCADYLFYPINSNELGLKWRKHVAGDGGTRSFRPPGLSTNLQLEFPSRVPFVREVVAEIVEACERLAFSGPRATLNLRVAVGEALSNAILYGNEEDPGKLVRVTAALRPGVAEVTVTDEGPGFDPQAVLDPTRPENRERSHGRGLFLLRSLADDVRFNARGNSVTLTLGSEAVSAEPGPIADRVRSSARPQRSERLEEYLDSFHRLTGIRSRLVVESGGSEVTVHDSLGDARGVEFTESSWLVMPSVRIRLATAPASRQEDRLFVALLRESASRLVASENEVRFFSGRLADRYEEIDLLTSVGETLGSVIHLERAAGRLLERLANVLAADCAAIWVPSDGGGLRRLAVGGPAARELAAAPAPDAQEWIDRALHLQLSQVRGRQGRGRAETDRTFLAVPLRHSALHGSTLPVGVLAARGREAKGTFSQGEVSLAATVAAQLAAAIENDRLARESLVQERMLVELELAHHLQMKLLPDLGDFVGVADVAGRCEPADSVGGDFYHLFRLPGNRLGVMLGDVSSHGYSAGLIMALTMSAASITAREREEPSEVLRGIHHELVRKLESTEMYMTLCYAVLDPGAGTIRYANAGHPHAFRVSATEVQRLDALNPPLGIAEFDAYSQREVSWTQGQDMLLMFTDGISECLESDRLWSDERLTQMAMQLSGSSAQEVLDRVFELAAAPAGVAADDRTALVVK